MTDSERFFSYVSKDTNITSSHVTTPCWSWTGYLDDKGRARFALHRNNVIASRYMWKLTFNEEPLLHVLHKCDNGKCVNPEHLFLGTNKDNVDDKMAKGRHQNQGKTHCINGHEFTLENTIVRKNGYRNCRICQRRADLKYKIYG